ncbi:MAG: phospholipase D-like domain-containing protein [Alphaproteobacteria bacterium]|nr:phospholipase D-like domain-containing protein [Alphaproteobacteria bacterium]
MRGKVRFFALLLLGLFSACAQLPDVDGDIASAQALRLDNTLQPVDAFHTEGERIAGKPFIPGNRVDLLADGAQSYPAMLAAIGAAHRRIDMEIYMFDEKEGEKFAAALIRKRKAGVAIHLICDAWGSNDTPEALFDEMEDAGIDIVYFNPLDPLNVIDTGANHRDHRKLLIVDGRVAFTGGVNITEVYRLKLRFKRAIGRTGGDDDGHTDIGKLPWRDSLVRIEGPAAAQFENLFLDDWASQKGPPLSIPPAPPPPLASGVPVQALEVAPDIDRFSIYRSLISAITLARHSVHLSTGYFAPTPDMIDALQDAAERGVDVQLILPSQSDSTLALEAGHADYEDLLESGVKIYERQGVVLHAKTTVIDGLWSTVGSYNLDWRSILFNNECNAVILSPSFGAEMERAFTNDRLQSSAIDAATWNDRPFIQRLREWRARLLISYL